MDGISILTRQFLGLVLAGRLELNKRRVAAVAVLTEGEQRFQGLSCREWEPQPLETGDVDDQ